MAGIAAQDNGGGNHRARQRAAPDLVDAADGKRRIVPDFIVLETEIGTQQNA